MSKQGPIPPFYQRHRLSLLLALLVASLGIWVALFLARFDLNDYRAQLQVSLSDYLEMPVRLGTARLRLQDIGIAVSFAELHLGSEQTDLEIMAPEFWVLLEWRGLLLRKPSFSRVGLNRPNVRITQRPEAPQSARIDMGMLLDAHIRNLSIRDGRLQISSQQATGGTRLLELHDITASIQDIGLGRPCQVELKGTLQQQTGPARLKLHGSLEPPSEMAAWQATNLNLHLEATGLDSATLMPYRPAAAAEVSATGRFDTALQFSGTPGNGITIRAELSSTELRIKPGRGYPEGVPVQNFLASGMVRHQGQDYLVEELNLNLDGLHVAGALVLSEDPATPFLQIRLTNSRLPVAAVKRWLPGTAETDPLRRQLAGQGEFWIDQGELRFSPQQATARAWLVSLQGAIDGLSWDFGKGYRAELGNLQFNYAGDLCRLNNGRLQLGPLALGFDGSLATPQDGPASLDLKVTGQAESAEMLAWLWPERPEELAANGLMTIGMQLTGPPQRLLTDLAIDLGAVELRYADTLHLPIDATARFSLNGTLDGQGFSAEHAHLHWQGLEGWLNGRFGLGENHKSALQARLEIADLATARQLLPRAENLGIHGAATADLTWTGTGAPPTISISLTEVAIATGGALADLAHLNGRLHLTENGLQSEPMRVHLGSSPIRFMARLADFANPVLELEVEADTLRADELIFYSDLSVLRNIKGKLAISGSAVELKPVDVTLDGGTQARVNGRIEIAEPPRVFLDITSDFARVDEIIGLWTNQSERAAEARQARSQTQTGPQVQAEVEIRAHAKTGELYGMAFQQAEATIVPRHDMLIIHPLDFKVGEGYCNAQVLVDYSSAEASLLRISGHAEDVDAYQVHNELLKRKSILRGSLRGDFYLQGIAGSSFLPTSYGSFDLTARDGVLRQSPILSKVFSILNVSQLFSLKLPDMDQEGLPYRKISGKLTLDQGQLISEGLLLESEAMNQTYIGNFNLIDQQVDLILAARPLGTVDKIVSRLPVAGWLLTGEDKALITAHFEIKGPTDDPEITAIPITSISKTALGIIRRTLELPVKLFEKPAVIWGGD